MNPEPDPFTVCKCKVRGWALAFVVSLGLWALALAIGLAIYQWI